MRTSNLTTISSNQGARQILHLLGYSQPTLSGVSYPPGTQPDRPKAAHVLADIMMVNHELLGYRIGTHPHLHVVDRVLPSHLRKFTSPAKPVSTEECFVHVQN